MADPVEYKPKGIMLSASQEVTVTLPPRAVRARLAGLLFDSSKCFPLPLSTKGIRAITKLHKEHPDGEVLIVGHTDRKASPDYNLTLSVERAEAVKALLLDEVPAWLAWYGAGKPAEKRWGTVEDQHMLATVKGADGAPFYSGPIDGKNSKDTEDAVRRFQAFAGAAVDGKCGDETRKALIKQFMAQDETSLPAGTKVLTHGCGEFHPVDKTTDEVRSQENRRVEVFIFDPAVQPPPPKKCPGPAGCSEHAKWLEKTWKTVDVTSEPGALTVLVTGEDEVTPIAGASVHLAGPESRDGVSGADGHIAFDDLIPGSYTIIASKDDLTSEASATVAPGAPASAGTGGGAKEGIGEVTAAKKTSGGGTVTTVSIKPDATKVLVTVNDPTGKFTTANFGEASAELVHSNGTTYKAVGTLVSASGEAIVEFPKVPLGQTLVYAERRQGGIVVGRAKIPVAHIKKNPDPKIPHSIPIVLEPVVIITVDLVEKVAKTKIAPEKVIVTVTPAEAEIDKTSKDVLRVVAPKNTEVVIQIETPERSIYKYLSEKEFKNAHKETIPGATAPVKKTVELERRNKIWFVTIDSVRWTDGNYPNEAMEDSTDPKKEKTGYTAVPNIDGVEKVAKATKNEHEVMWIGESMARLKNWKKESPLAVFGSGSWDEWSMQFHKNRTSWAKALKEWQAVLTDDKFIVPTIAFCGSHQLLCAAFSDWKNVAHMIPAAAKSKADGTDPEPTIDDEKPESAGKPARPKRDKRKGEVGLFPLKAIGTDDIFKGIEKHYYALHHEDFVVKAPDGFKQIFGRTTDKAYLPAYQIPVGDRCDSQGYVYTATEKRILYTVQFHPEIDLWHEFGKPGSKAYDEAKPYKDDGHRLLVNFIKIATDWWEKPKP